jgi:hypothetical protein
MTVPVNLLLIVQDAVFAAMEAGIAPEMGGAHQHVLQDTKPPLNIIGAMEWVNQGGKDDVFGLFTVEIQSIYRGGDRAQLIRQMHAVFLALHDQPLAGDGATLRPAAFVDASVSDVGPDGQTYVGITNFEIYAEPA